MLTSNAQLVGVVSKLSRSFVKPCLHVGEQSAGGTGWRARGGNWGGRGGWTLTGDNGGAVAQPVSSTASNAHVDAVTLELVMGNISRLSFALSLHALPFALAFRGQGMLVCALFALVG